VSRGALTHHFESRAVQRARQALAIAHCGAILDGGQVALQGKAATLLADERAVEPYLGSHGAVKASPTK
jgi:ABC-type lipopolysaccharide export system ATPase subunit